MTAVTFVVDGKAYCTDHGLTIMDFAKQSNLFIPGLFYFAKAPHLVIAPDYTVYHGSVPIQGDETESSVEQCGLCMVKIDGERGFRVSCETRIESGMIIDTDTPKIQRLRREKFKQILSSHPSARRPETWIPNVRPLVSVSRAPTQNSVSRVLDSGTVSCKGSRVNICH